MPAPVRRRPRRHSGGSNTEVAVFEATERLMTTAPFAEIIVADILGEAGISRANFYHYFASKFDVLAALTSRILGEAYADTGPWRAPAGRDRARSLDQSLRETLEAWAEHGPVMHAAIEWMHEVPEVATAWAQMRERFVTSVAEQVRHETPDDPAPDVTATVLVCGLERSFYVSSRGLDARIPTPDATVLPLARIARAGIYGTGGPGVATRTGHDVAEPARSSPGGADDSGPEGAPTMDSTILDGLNDLLLELPLQDVSVARILEKAGASRASFYFYFASKDDAFLALYQRVARDVTDGFAAVLRQYAASAPDTPGLVADWLTLDERTAAVFRNAVHTWPRQQDLATAYLGDHARMVDALVASLRDAAPDDVDTHGLDAFAATLLWTVERSIAGLLVQEEHLADRALVVDALGRLMASAFGQSVVRDDEA